jgi:hypothetical protein
MQNECRIICSVLYVELNWVSVRLQKNFQTEVLPHRTSCNSISYKVTVAGLIPIMAGSYPTNYKQVHAVEQCATNIRNLKI